MASQCCGPGRTGGGAGRGRGGAGGGRGGARGLQLSSISPNPKP